MSTHKVNCMRLVSRIVVAASMVSLMAAAPVLAQQSPAAQEKVQSNAPPQTGKPAATTPQTSGSQIVNAGQDEEHFEIEKQPWTFAGLFGYFDTQQLRRGYKVYKNVCSNCHNMRFLSFRNLGEPGGPEFPKEVVDEIAAETQVTDGVNAEGQPITRPGKPADNFQWRFKNEKEAAAALNAVPPDLSVIEKARTVERDVAWYAFPYVLAKDLATQYQEQGADYIYALLTSYRDPPASKQMASGMNYNLAFPGHQIAMPQPLQDGLCGL